MEAKRDTRVLVYEHVGPARLTAGGGEGDPVPGSPAREKVSARRTSVSSSATRSHEQEKTAPNGHVPHDDVIPDTPQGDVFDNLAALRLDQNFSNRLKGNKPLIECPIRKPRPHEWFRVNPEWVFETELFEFKEDMSPEWYLVIDETAKLALDGPNMRPVRLHVWINRKGFLHIWAIKLPGVDGKSNDWNSSAAECCKIAMQHWVCVETGSGYYQPVVAENENLPGPVWPKQTLNNILRVAFKGGRTVDSPDHPLLARIAGEKFG
jgi:hypothetical protein